jgi:uncharacterized Fe-S cluster-containing radical SAM superfamily protein
MKKVSKEYIINTVYNDNVLPVTSECNTSCIFCSNRQNPEGVEVFRLPDLDIHDFEELAGYLSPDRKIIIGESATRISEGEPLLHKDFLKIVELLRKKYAKTPIQITTNGILMDEETVSRLQRLENIEISLSVNCIDPEKRKRLLGDRGAADMRKKLRMLKGRLKYSASFVAVPEIIGINDMKEIISELDRNEASMVKVYLPGYTRKYGKTASLESAYQETAGKIRAARAGTSIPVVVEPPVISDLICTVEGVVKGSPSADAGIAEGDIITEVNGCEVYTRVDAFNRAYTSKNPELTVKSGDRLLKVTLNKPEDTSPGFIVLYDADPDLIQKARKTAAFYKARKVLFVTSGLAYNAITALFAKIGFEFDYEVICAENVFFGGTIKCAGLLTARDITERVDRYLVNYAAPELIILPPAMFDYRKRDLLGTSLGQIAESIGIAVDTV